MSVLKVSLISLSILISNLILAQVTVSPVLGSQNLAIVPFDYALDSNHAPPSHIDSAFFRSTSSMKAFFEEASYGKMTFDGTIFPYRTNRPPLYGIGYTNCYPNDSVISNQPDIDYSSIEGMVLLVHDTISGKSCAAGNSSSEKLPFTTTSGSQQFRRSGFRTPFYFPNDFSQTTSSTIAHELMHSIGNSFHSNSYVKENGEWKVQGYGNLFDILGLRSQASHPWSMLKHKLGWLTENEIEHVQNTDTFRIYPLEKTLPGQTQCLIIELPNQMDLQPNDTFKFDYLYLEYRGLTGFDYRSSTLWRVRLKDGSYLPNDSILGLSIVGVDCNSYEDCRPILIDMHPEPIGGQGASYFPHEASDAPLLLGEQYNVVDNSIDIEVIEVNEGNYIEVFINMPGGTTNVSTKSETELGIYPSPVYDFLQIEALQNSFQKIEIYDTFGNLVLTEKMTDKLDLSQLTKGMYVLILINSANEKRVQRPILKM